MNSIKWVGGIAVVFALGLQAADARRDGWTPPRASDHEVVAADGRGRVDIEIAEPEAVTDRTQFDCRVVVGYRVNRTSRNRGVQKWPVRECPHTEQMAAGKCETHWFKGMRCTVP